MNMDNQAQEIIQERLMLPANRIGARGLIMLCAFRNLALRRLIGSKVRAVKSLALLSILAAALLNLLNFERLALAQSNFYQGKIIRVIVGTSGGGGYDLWARLMAQHIGKHIPGNPTVVVQNMPGAGGVVAANYLYSIAKPDGLTIGAFNPALYFDQLVGRPEVKFDWGKFSWIGSPEQNDVLHFIRTDAPFKTIDDLRNTKEPPRCGSTGTGTTGHYIPRLLEETLGIKTTIVGGYQGGSEIDLAVERNEVVCWSPLIATYFGREPYKRWQNPVLHESWCKLAPSATNGSRTCPR